MKVKNCWLTLNRVCNLRCEWCYAKESKFKSCDDMPFNMARNLIDMCVANGIKHFVLIGGEPTIHPSFFEIIDYIVKIGYKSTIVTNGIQLAEDDFCRRLSKYRENVHVSVSLKGSNNQYYKEHCGAAVFERVLKGVNNCKTNGLLYSLTYVLSAENISTVDVFAKEIRERGLDDYIAFSFCNEVIQPSGEFENAYKQVNPLLVNKLFFEKYEIINNILDGRFTLHQTYPLCMCDKEAIFAMKQRKQISTSCHVHNRTGIIFDTNGSILLCNHFIGYGIGKYGEDYSDAISLASFWNSDKMVELHHLLISMPSTSCLACDLQNNCGGGCCIQWFSHNFKEYQQFMKMIY